MSHEVQGSLRLPCRPLATRRPTAGLKATRLLLVLLLAGPAFGQGASLSAPRIDVSLYPYQRTVENDTDFTATINWQLSQRFSYFSYANMQGVVTEGDAVFARSEQNLRFAVSDTVPIDLSLQGVIIRGGGNDVYQLGVSWRIHDTPSFKDFFDRINLIYRLTFHLKRFETDDDAWQMEHFFLMTFPGMSDRLYFSGFIDQTFGVDLPGSARSSPIVAELQLGMRLFNNFYAVAEYRNNDFRIGNEKNFAAGIEYKFRW